MTSGVTLAGGPARPFRPAVPLTRPMGWRGPRGFVPGRGRVRYSRWALLGVLLALVLAGGGVTAAKVAAAPAVPSVACSPGGSASALSPTQKTNALTIIAVGKSMGAPRRAQVVALATSMQESSLINTPGGDRDSAGLFQQRPSKGWGTYAQVTDPRYSAATFYHRLLAVPGWDHMAVTKAAQTVQRSAFPDAYAKWESKAQALVGGTTCKNT